MDPSIFKAYDIRGIYPDQLDEEAAWKIGYASAQFLRLLIIVSCVDSHVMRYV
jgi:phosphomannomutase